uniref:HMA domain-containing protein n=1 Tax=Leersia perrieri TaxID=77586 RepID=A0A0D9XIJ0_9ORYZ
MSSLVITVDLGCSRSFTKIGKTLCKLQESEDIRAILYDDKAGTVTISGGFDPLVLPCKLRRKAASVIKDIHLKEEKKNKHRAPSPPPSPARGAAFCSSCGAAVVPAAPPCYGVQGCPGIQMFTYDEPSPACSIM